MKKCPLCYNEVSEHAETCSFCGGILNTNIVPRQSGDISPYDHAEPQNPQADLAIPKDLTRWRGKPLVQGTIRLTNETQKHEKGGDFVNTLARGMNPWWGGDQRVLKAQYHFRIEDLDGNVIGAVMDGEYDGPPLEQGDFVSLWGYKRNNVVYIKLFYNHNLKSGFKVT